MSFWNIYGSRSVRLAGLTVALTALVACDEAPKLGFLQSGDASGDSAGATSTTTQVVERDVEAPDVFEVSEAGLWDGRPSLGGVWVAHPDVENPERVIIRNQANGKFVIGALFKREREIPGPRLQASSGAAEALGMLAGAPVELNVTALRKEVVQNTPEETPALDAPAAVQTASLPAATATSTDTGTDPIAAAAAAIEAAGTETTPKPSEAVARAAAQARPKSPLSKPYIQIGIFSIEANANRSAAQMRNDGMVPTIFKEQLNGKTYWRVVVGPAMSSGERSALLKQIRETGFSDAFAVVK